jgi:hypothetical protein
MELKLKNYIELAISLFIYKFLLDQNEQKLAIAQELKKSWETTLDLLNQNKLAPIKRSYKLVIESLKELIKAEENRTLRSFMKTLLKLLLMIRREGNKSKEYYTVLNFSKEDFLKHPEMQKSQFLLSTKQILIKTPRKKE